ncbi:fluoride efflux transporter FluC [Oerskovia flava]|uniref:fluoride efflux transporter FluC n=1 Tax=Oerskovia flava TaxID=2986422 RepID=UPI00223EB917|nr:CrcB family protein [Oerskovia sp. JB1-3-2]
MTARNRPAHLDLSLVALVALGGALGSAARFGLTEVWAPVGGLPVATLTANVAGAFLLGALLETLARRGAETPRARRVRLGLGTGVLGGFTTFSSLALEAERLLAGSQVLLSLGYAVGSLVLGLAACLGGILLARRVGLRIVARTAGTREPTT